MSEVWFGDSASPSVDGHTRYEYVAGDCLHCLHPESEHRCVDDLGSVDWRCLPLPEIGRGECCVCPCPGFTPTGKMREVPR
jgi:hypothetical protein